MGVEDRLRHLEHHAAMLVTNNRNAETKERLVEREAANREIQLATKEKKICAMLENHIARELERVVRIEEQVNQHTVEI